MSNRQEDKEICKRLLKKIQAGKISATMSGIENYHHVLEECQAELVKDQAERQEKKS